MKTSANARRKSDRSPHRRTEQTPLDQRARPTAERLRRARGHFERGHSGQITMRDSPLERAYARSLITPEQYAAAQKYRHHWFHAGLCDPLGSLDLTRVFGGDHGGFSGMARTENQVFHRKSYREAVDAVGKIGAHVLDSAVCREISLEHVGYGLGWTLRQYAHGAAAERMKVALDALCKLCGMGT
jgi:hypothetical protein